MAPVLNCLLEKRYITGKYLISETRQVSNWYIPHSIIYSWVEFMVSWFLEDQETVQPCKCTPLVLSPDHILSKQSGEPSQISWASEHFCDSVTWNVKPTKKRYRYLSRDEQILEVLHNNY